MDSDRSAKLQEGDVILQFNKTAAESDAHLVNLVNLTEIGKEVSLTVYRGGQTFNVKAIVTDRNKF